MFSLQKMLGKEDEIFTLLEASAEEARTGVQALANFNNGLGRPTGTEESAQPRHKARQITEQITVAVYRTYITTLQREDIQALSNALYRIPKTVDKFTERASLAPHLLHGVDFSRQIALLDAASGIVLQLVKSLRHSMNLKSTKELNDQLKSLENQADKLMPAIYSDLFSGRFEAVQAIFLKDLFELLEKAIDRCRSVGTVISRIVLKNS